MELKRTRGYEVSMKQLADYEAEENPLTTLISTVSPMINTFLVELRSIL